MKQLNWIIPIGLLLLTACGKPTPTCITYQKPICFNVNKSAVLQWDYGKQYDAQLPNTVQADSLLGAVIANSIHSIDRANNPSRYSVAYGKAEQAVFMTSLRDVLRQNQVFKEVLLASETDRVVAKDALINIFFKTSRISSVERNFKITLTVVLTITTHGKPIFTRTYLVQSEPDGFLGNHTNTNVSTKLLDRIIAGIEEWHDLNSKGAK